jgi:Tfp pilus assembly protein PilO
VNEKKLITCVAGGALVAGLGLGWLIYSEYESIAQAREKVAQLRTQIDQARKLLAGTPELEKDVIVLRETEAAIKEILPDDKDLYNLNRDLQRFSEEAEVSVTSIKKKDQVAARKGTAEAFDQVKYELTLEGDAFQVLSFLDRIEGHQRFLRIPSINWTASTQKKIEETGRAAHKVKLELETYVYKPQGGPEPIKIEGYNRKRELLLGEVARRREAIAVESFPYRGQRGRRDPWIDPRVPRGEIVEGPPVPEQMETVSRLAEQLAGITKLWEEYKTADLSVVERMTLLADVEQKLGSLEEEARIVLNSGRIRYPMAESRFQREVLEPMAMLRNEIIAKVPNVGPSAETMREILETMQRHTLADEPRLALDAFATVEPNLEATVNDPLRQGLAESLKQAAAEARILLDFNEIPLKVSGVAIQQGRPPVALINGKALSEGDLVQDELVIRSIRQGEIEFMFRGVILVRRSDRR